MMTDDSMLHINKFLNNKNQCDQQCKKHFDAHKYGIVSDKWFVLTVCYVCINHCTCSIIM